MKFDIFFQLILEDNIGMKDFSLDIKKLGKNLEILYINDTEICKFQNLKKSPIQINCNEKHKLNLEKIYKDFQFQYFSSPYWV